MEDLNRQQVILLTLFVTFVTSIATGIVTVSLMDQAPTGATNTVERVIERTVADATGNDTSSNTATAISAASAASASAQANPTDIRARAVNIASNSLVRIALLDPSGNGSSTVTGIGVIVSKKGLILTDKSAVAVFGSYVAILPDGKNVPVAIIQSQDNGDIVFLAVALAQSAGETFTPAVFVPTTGTNAPALGQSIVVLSGSDSTTVDEGYIRRINTNTDAVTSTPILAGYTTSITSSSTIIGSLLFNFSGQLVGIKTLSLNTLGNTSGSDNYYPVSLLSSAIPVINAGTQAH